MVKNVQNFMKIGQKGPVKAWRVVNNLKNLNRLILTGLDLSFFLYIFFFFGGIFVFFGEKNVNFISYLNEKLKDLD